MPQQKLDDALEQLAGAELIFRRGTAPDATYTLKHALVQDAAYRTLLRSRRQQLHGRIAAVLEKQFPEIVDAQPELLAHHCAQAGLTEKAVGYWLSAGRQAIARGTMTEAAPRLRKGLDLLSSLPEGTAWLERELDLQIELAHALVATMGYSAKEPGEVIARERQLCDELGSPPQLGPVLYNQLVFHFVGGELDQAEHDGQEFLRQSEIRNDINWKHAGLMFSGAVSSVLGKFSDPRSYFQAAISMWDPGFRDFIPSPEDPYVAVRNYLHRALLCLGYMDQACLRREEALAEARRISPFNVCYASYQACMTYWAIEGVKSLPIVLRSADEILAIADEDGFALWSAVGKMIRGWCLGAGGQTVEGIALLIQGLADARAVGCGLTLPFYLTTLGEIYGVAGQPEEGIKRLDEALAMLESTQERWTEAETHRMRGTLLLSMQDQSAAEYSFNKALAVARQQSARFWELRAALDLARLWRDQSKRAEGRDLVAPIYGWFTEGLDTPILQDAKALLEELAS